MAEPGHDVLQLSTDGDGWPVDDAAVQVHALAKSLGVVHQNRGLVTNNTSNALDHPCRSDDDDSDAGAEASSSSSVSVDPKILRGYCSTAPLPWSTFLRLRRSWGHIKLSDTQEENVFRALEKIPQGVGKIYDSLPFVSAFVDKHCPEMRHSNLSTPRPGATLLLLSVITGNVTLCERCLLLGANPNSCKFLTDTDVGDNQMRHGYSPMFLACICEQIDIMDLLRQHGGSIHIMDRWGRTPLHAAAAMGSTEVLMWLVKEGAPRKVVDCDLLVPGEMCVGKVMDALVEPTVLMRSSGELKKPCACQSGKMFMHCGCVDDMYSRWYAARLRSQWSTSFSTIRNLQSANPPSPATIPPAANVKATAAAGDARA